MLNHFNPKHQHPILITLCALSLLCACQSDRTPAPAGRTLPEQATHTQTPDDLPILYDLPTYTLTTHTNKPFSSTQLKGHPYVATFFFTRCSTMCPPLMQAAKALRLALDAEGLQQVHVVSFSVDPAFDTPDRLNGYANQLDLDLSRWTLLTGPPDDLTRLITGSFKLHVGTPSTDPQGMMDIAHTGHLVLIDSQGRIRKFISTSDAPNGERYRNRADAVPDAMRSIRDLLQREANGGT